MRTILSVVVPTASSSSSRFSASRSDSRPTTSLPAAISSTQSHDRTSLTNHYLPSLLNAHLNLNLPSLLNPYLYLNLPSLLNLYLHQHCQSNHRSCLLTWCRPSTLLLPR